MYKTVRQGENSLQYKILAQQEEGIANLKCRKSSKGRTAGVITVILLLICGIAVTAVLIPLLFTNDFITLSGTFQKFSVATLRRSHSGVIIAKRPHGWNSSRVLQPPLKSTSEPLNHASNKTKETTMQTEPSLKMNTPSAFTTTPKTTNFASNIETTTQKQIVLDVTTNTLQTKFTPSTSAGTDEIKVQEESILRYSPPLFPFVQRRDGVQTDMVLSLKEMSTTGHPPVWYERQKWSFQSPASFESWRGSFKWDHLFIAVGGFCALICMLILAVLLRRSVPGRNKSIQIESAELKEDNTRLLKPSARTSDEE